jgi:hypothetical protein
MATIILAGSSGLIGSALVKRLAKSHRVIQLSTSREDPNHDVFLWDSNDLENSKGLLKHEWFEKADAIINLSGTSIAGKRWSSARKEAILKSRINSTKTLINTVNKFNPNIHFINASAIGYFGDRQEAVTESSSKGKGFMADVCDRWEKETQIYSGNLSIVRIGVVLSPDGGFLKTVLAPAKWAGLISLGSGKQVISWIHIDDLVSMFIALVDKELSPGIYNGTAPSPESLDIVTKKIAEQTGIFKWPFNVPAFALQLVMGEMSQIVLDGAAAIPEKAMELGFTFSYSELESALNHLLHEN